MLSSFEYMNLSMTERPISTSQSRIKPIEAVELIMPNIHTKFWKRNINVEIGFTVIFGLVNKRIRGLAISNNQLVLSKASIDKTIDKTGSQVIASRINIGTKSDP